MERIYLARWFHCSPVDLREMTSAELRAARLAISEEARAARRRR
jgi:hypothetical protein